MASDFDFYLVEIRILLDPDLCIFLCRPSVEILIVHIHAHGGYCAGLFADGLQVPAEAIFAYLKYPISAHIQCPSISKQSITLPEVLVALCRASITITRVRLIIVHIRVVTGGPCGTSVIHF